MWHNWHKRRFPISNRTRNRTRTAADWRKTTQNGVEKESPNSTFFQLFWLLFDSVLDFLGPRGREPGNSFRTLSGTFTPKGPNDPCGMARESQGEPKHLFHWNLLKLHLDSIAWIVPDILLQYHPNRICSLLRTPKNARERGENAQKSKEIPYNEKARKSQKARKGRSGRFQTVRETVLGQRLIEQAFAWYSAASW